MISLKDIIESQTDIFNGKKVKLVRHKDEREEYRELLKSRDTLLEYQKEQGKPVFKDCDYILSFIGTERKRSIFFGVFKVEGVQLGENGKYYYDLTEIPDLAHLNDRLVIDWGNNAIAWHQWYHLQEKEVIELLPAGYIGTFPGLLDFVLDFEDLIKLTNNPAANHDWKNHLSSVNGIYLILDTSTGNQYIGSACGQSGIWQRWCDYAKTIHGGNKLLKVVQEQNPNCHRNFKYSILQTLPSNITQKEIIKIENLYKEKLGTKAFGLNGN
jgi:hypothetical protein